MRVMHKDMAKQDVASKTLQRDVQRYQEAEESARKSIDILRHDNDSLTSDVARLAAENADLQARLAEVLRRCSDVQHAEVQTDTEHAAVRLSSSPLPVPPPLHSHESSLGSAIVPPSPPHPTFAAGLGAPPSGAVLSNVSRRLKLIAEQLSAQNLNE